MNTRDENRSKRVSHLEEDLERKAEAIMREFRPYTQGIRYLALLHRSKEGGNQNSEYKRRGGHAIVHNEKEYYDAVVRLLTLQAVSSKPYRLYACLNPRDLKKAEHKLKISMLDAEFGSEENREVFYERMDARWVSAVMDTGSRKSSLFLIDADEDGVTKDVTAPTLMWLSKNGVDVLKQYKTPNGWHIITPPFNPTGWDVPNAEVKKDALLLLSAA